MLACAMQNDSCMDKTLLEPSIADIVILLQICVISHELLIPTGHIRTEMYYIYIYIYTHTYIYIV